MDKHELKNRIEYIVVCVSEFAKRFKLTNQQAYAYLRRFTGIEFLNEYYAYEKVTGIKLPRNSAQQKEFCNSLRKGDVLPGDLVFFATGKDPEKVSHVGIMIDDNRFIHASSSKGVVVSDASQPYYQRTFKGFGRVPD